MPTKSFLWTMANGALFTKRVRRNMPYVAACMEIYFTSLDCEVARAFSGALGLKWEHEIIRWDNVGEWINFTWSVDSTNSIFKDWPLNFCNRLCYACVSMN